MPNSSRKLIKKNFTFSNFYILKCRIRNVRVQQHNHSIYFLRSLDWSGCAKNADDSQIPMSIFILCTNLAMGSMKYFLWIGFMFELTFSGLFSLWSSMCQRTAVILSTSQFTFQKMEVCAQWNVLDNLFKICYYMYKKTHVVFSFFIESKDLIYEE